MNPTTTTRASLALVLALALLALVAAPTADASYRAVQCHPALGAGHQDARFARTSAHYLSSAGCRDGGDGLAVRHEARNTPAGAWGGWTVGLPRETELVAVRASVAGARQGGHVPELVVGEHRGDQTRIGDAQGEFHTLAWQGATADEVTARLRCAWRRGCGPGRAAHVAVRRLVLTIRDLVDPQLSLEGSLLAAGSRRGSETLSPVATDSGSGVRRVVVEVNGEPVAARRASCALSAGVGLRVQPCPETFAADIAAATDAAPFVQGPNEVRVCAADYSADTSANQACVRRAVRVDNACPLASSAAHSLVARFALDDRRLEVARGEESTVVGRLVDARGVPVAGVRACVATRVPLDGVAETVVATPRTDADGRFSARLPAGPSREVRVASWPDDERALERMLALETRADPGLRLRPDRILRNGERVEFVTRLAPPRNVGRTARIEVRSGGEWLRLRAGRTSSNGVWRTGYRFHATTRTRTYRFRACVPTQDGYPYTAGCSATRRQTVTR